MKRLERMQVKRLVGREGFLTLEEVKQENCKDLDLLGKSVCCNMDVTAAKNELIEVYDRTTLCLEEISIYLTDKIVPILIRDGVALITIVFTLFALNCVNSIMQFAAFIAIMIVCVVIASFVTAEIMVCCYTIRYWNEVVVELSFELRKLCTTTKPTTIQDIIDAITNLKRCSEEII